MYGIRCVNHEAAEEVLTVLENYGYRGHIDGIWVKSMAEITDEAVCAEIFPFKAFDVREWESD